MALSDDLGIDPIDIEVYRPAKLHVDVFITDAEQVVAVHPRECFEIGSGSAFDVYAIQVGLQVHFLQGLGWALVVSHIRREVRMETTQEQFLKIALTR